MTTHQFTLIVDGPDLQTEGLADQLFEVGCDDALIGRSNGVQFLDFDRESPSLEDAVLSAIADAEKVEGLEVVRLADAGLVSMADIAARAGRTRESVRLLVTGERGPGGFPPPVNDPRSRYRLWRSSEVQLWFEKSLNEGPSRPDDQVLAAINAGLELRHLGRQFWRGRSHDLHDLIGIP
jgi:hypothetical protein